MGIYISDYIALGSLLVAVLSLVIGLIPILRDRAKLDFSLYVSTLVTFPNGKTKNHGNYYFFKIVNIGRRPVTIVNIGGISEVPWYEWWLFLALRYYFVPKNFILSSVEIISCLKDQSGNDKTLNEGISSQAHLKILDSDLLNGQTLKAMRFWVMDSTGRKYYLPKKSHKKFKKDLEELKKEASYK
jgi:hypothetical protein